MGAPWQLTDMEWGLRFSMAADRLSESGWLLSLDRRMREAEAHGERVTYLGRRDPLSHAERVGVFTGSFNPVTWAHVAVAHAAHDEFRLDQLTWACSRVTVDKEQVARATLLDRLAQLEVMAEAEGRGDQVAEVAAGLYVEQARALRAVLGERGSLVLIVGYDKIEQILDPRYYADRDRSLAELFASAELCVAPRAGSDEHALAELLALPANRRYAKGIHYLPLAHEVAGLSSTEARARAASCTATDANALATITPPEGAALACTTGAYGAVSAQPSDDAYAWRQRWLAALREGGFSQRAGVDLRVLVARTADATDRGERIRRWLRGERQNGDLASVEQALGLALG